MPGWFRTDSSGLHAFRISWDPGYPTMQSWRLLHYFWPTESCPIALFENRVDGQYPSPVGIVIALHQLLDFVSEYESYNLYVWITVIDLKASCYITVLTQKGNPSNLGFYNFNGWIIKIIFQLHHSTIPRFFPDSGSDAGVCAIALGEHFEPNPRGDLWVFAAPNSSFCGKGKHDLVCKWHEHLWMLFWRPSVLEMEWYLYIYNIIYIYTTNVCIYIYIISTFYFVLLDSFTLLLQQEDVKQPLLQKTSGSVHHPQCDAWDWGRPGHGMTEHHRWARECRFV